MTLKINHFTIQSNKQVIEKTSTRIFQYSWTLIIWSVITRTIFGNEIKRNFEKYIHLVVRYN